MGFELAYFAGFLKAFYDELDEYRKSFCNIFADSAPAIFLTSHISNRDGLLDLDYADTKEVLRFLPEKYNDCFLWGTDAPWVYAAGLDAALDCVIDSGGLF